MIEFKNVYKTYPNGFTALKGINLQIEQGEFVAIIGLSGAGKSTILRCINRMHDITKGELTVDGVDVDALAVSIGNAHGLYKSEPKLDFELLRSIRKLKAQVPHLVLHGGSGLQDKVVRSAIQEGVRKINVATEIRLAYLEGLRATMDSRDIYTYISVA